MWKNKNIIVGVAVENTAYSFDKIFDYSVQDDLSEQIAVGCRVLVPFGKGNKKRQAMVVSVSENSGEKKLKEISKILDEAPVMTDEMIHTAMFMKEHYFCPLYDALKAMLPAGINYKLTVSYSAIMSENLSCDELNGEEKKVLNFLVHSHKPVQEEKLLDTFDFCNNKFLLRLIDKNLIVKTENTARLTGDAVMKMVALNEDADYSKVKMTPKQKSVFELLQVVGSVSVKEICYFTGVTTAVVNALEAKGLVFFYESEVFRTPNPQKDKNHTPVVLTVEQNKALQELLKIYKNGKPAVSLLYGITGSGKTSVFIKLIEKVLENDRGVIVMVPEISLTPQFINTFKSAFGESVAVFHSALSMGERLDEYKRVQKGIAKIAIGTRSAVFAPFEKLGLIIMDEEQEATYKSEATPRYHARDVAKFRIAQHNALLLLSSATPSIESFYYAKTGRYSLSVLKNRYGNAVLPKVIISDMNVETQNGNYTGFSETLLENLRYNIENGKQSILLLNRRGYNTFVSCPHCQEVVVCPHCSITMTYHNANHRLMCHYCGYSIEYSDECPNCHSKGLKLCGSGTQKAEEELENIFPQARILRMDADVTMTKYSHEKKFSAFSKGDYDILIGTQMVAKGLNFPNVTLVGVLNADQTLYSDDFRSYERAFSLLTQVVGRSGRGEESGIAVIQTYTPENNIISLAAEQNYDKFYSGEIAIRKAMLYPPFADICMVGFVGDNQINTEKASKTFLSMLVEIAKKDYPDLPLRILGPSAAQVVKVSNKFRFKLILKCRNNKKFREMISTLLIEFSKNREFSHVTAFVDMNTLSL